MQIKSQDVVIFSKKGCPYCELAKSALKEHGYDYVEYYPKEEERHRTLRALTGRTTSPQIFIDSKHIGGYDDLKKFLKI